MVLIHRSAPVLCLALLVGCTDRPEQDPLEPNTSLPLTLQDLDQRILQRPNDPAAYAARARFFESKDSARAAINDWQRAIALDSTALAWRIALGDLHYRRVDLPKAEAQFTKAIQLAPDSTGPWLKMAEISLVQKKYPEAMQMANEALRLDDQNAKAYFLKGWIHSEAGDTALSISSYRTAVERDRDFYEAYIALGLLHAAKKDPLAMQYYNSAVELRPGSVEAWYDRGMFAQETGQDSIALACYARIKVLDPKNPTAWYNTGYILLEHQDRIAEARNEFSQAIVVLPTYAAAYYNRGLTYELENKLDSALLDYRQALALQPAFDLAAQGLGRLQSKGIRVRDRP